MGSIHPVQSSGSVYLPEFIGPLLENDKRITLASPLEKIALTPRDLDFIQEVERVDLGKKDISILSDDSMASLEELRDLRASLEDRMSALGQAEKGNEVEMKGLEKLETDTRKIKKDLKKLDIIIKKLEEKKAAEDSLNKELFKLQRLHVKSQALQNIQPLTGKETDEEISQFVENIRVGLQQEKNRILTQKMNFWIEKFGGDPIKSEDSEGEIGIKVQKALDNAKPSSKITSSTSPLAEYDQNQGEVQAVTDAQNQRATLQNDYQQYLGKAPLADHLKRVENEIQPFEKEAKKITGGFWQNIGKRMSGIFSIFHFKSK